MWDHGWLSGRAGHVTTMLETSYRFGGQQYFGKIAESGKVQLCVKHNPYMRLNVNNFRPKQRHPAGLFVTDTEALFLRIAV
jgi:hypothetical protein